MNNLFYDRMFNPQYVNPNYYHMLQQQQYECKQQEEIAKVLKAFHNLCEAAGKLDAQHQQITFQACLLKSKVSHPPGCEIGRQG